MTDDRRRKHDESDVEKVEKEDRQPHPFNEGDDRSGNDEQTISFDKPPPRDNGDE